MSRIIPTVVTTYSGREFDFMNPHHDMVCIEDIAHALSHLCRYTGHVERFYSVAQHCIHMAQHAHPDIRLEVLMHDAAEAYLGDIATPLKLCLPHYMALEARVQRCIAEKFGMDFDEPITQSNVKLLDWSIMKTEVEALMPPDTDWECLADVEALDLVIQPWQPSYAKAQFLEMFYGITGNY